MTRDETKILLKSISGVYANFKPSDQTATVDTWAVILSGYPYKEVMDSFVEYAKTDMTGFAPTPAVLIDRITRKYTKTMTELEAWVLVKKAISNGVYRAQEEFEKLPEEIQKAIGSASYIHDRATDENFNESVEASNFMRTYRVIAERQRQEYGTMPYLSLSAIQPDLIEDRAVEKESRVRATPERIDQLMAKMKGGMG